MAMAMAMAMVTAPAALVARGRTFANREVQGLRQKLQAFLHLVGDNDAKREYPLVEVR